MSNLGTEYNGLKDFISPLGLSLITLYLTYLLSRVNTFLTEKKTIRTKRLFYVDFLSLEFSKLISALDSLLNDLDENAVFNLRRISSANQAAQELKRMIPDVVILPSESLREEYIGVVDVSVSLVLSIQAVEDLNEKWRKEYNNTLSSADYELNSLRIELLKINIGLDDNLQPIALNNKKINPKQINYISEIVNKIKGKKTSALSKWTRDISFCKDKRTVLSTRILDAKSKLVDINSVFEKLKTDTLK